MFDHCLYFNTTALARVVEREWAQAFKPLGVTPPQGFLLRLVLARPGLSQFELADELTISRPTATRLSARARTSRARCERDGSRVASQGDACRCTPLLWEPAAFYTGARRCLSHDEGRERPAGGNRGRVPRRSDELGR
jgi:predicted DNA-binding protein (UPF0251 family)